MLCFVTKKWIKGNGFVQLLVDKKKGEFLESLEMHDSYSYVYCYHFESLSTTIREYRTLKQTEFCMMAPILMQPTLSLRDKNTMI
jgi:hypothetical protein